MQQKIDTWDVHRFEKSCGWFFTNLEITSDENSGEKTSENPSRLMHGEVG